MTILKSLDSPIKITVDLAGAATRRLRNGSVSSTSKLVYVHKTRN